MSVRIHWQSDCGHIGKMITAQFSLAGQVRAAVHDHDRKFKACLADINTLETNEQKECRELEVRRNLVDRKESTSE